MIYDRLRRLVVDGRIPVGVRVPESDLAAALDVSRTPVREALARLEGDGLVVARGRGVQVAVLDGTALDHVLQARGEFEAWSARQLSEQVAAGLVAPVRLTELAHLAAETDRLTRAVDLEPAVASNRTFHLRIAELAGNPVVLGSLELWWDQIVLATRQGLHRPARADAVADEHDEIIAAITEGRGDRAGEAARRHVTHTRRHLSEERT